MSEIKYLFVGDTLSDMIGNGRVVQHLRKELSALGVDESSCRFTAVELVDKEVDFDSLDRVYDAILESYPEVILPIGGPAMLALTGKSGITKNHGKDVFLSTIPDGIIYRDMLNWTRDHVKENEDVPYPSLWEFEYDKEENPRARDWQLRTATELLGYRCDLETLPVVPIIHPAHAFRHGGETGALMGTITEDISIAKGLVEQGENKVNVDYAWINTIEEVEEYCTFLLDEHAAGKLDVIAVDIETSEELGGSFIWAIAYAMSTRILTIQISHKHFQSRAFMVNHKQSVFNDPHMFRMLVHWITKVLTTIPVVGQNYTFDYNTLRCKLGIKGQRVIGDTMLMHHWWRMGQGLSSGLDQMGARYLQSGFHKRDSHRYREENPDATFEDFPLDLSLAYACADTDVTLRLYDFFKEEIKKEGRWDGYYEHHHGEHLGWNSICDLEWYGMPVEREELDRLNAEYPKLIEECMVEMHKSPFIAEFQVRALKVHNAAAVEYNDAIPEKSRKRHKVVYSYDEWVADPKNRYNPSSWKQAWTLWIDIMAIPVRQMIDIEYNVDCDDCGSAPCTCAVGFGISEELVSLTEKDKMWRTRPSTNSANRAIMLGSLKTWSNHHREKGNAEAANVYDEMRNVLTLHDKYKKMTKMYSTYVKGIYPLILDKVDLDTEVYDPKERCFPAYKDFCEFPAPWSLHPSYRMNGTLTGRLASSNPNGQNWPKFKSFKEADVKQPCVSRWKGKGGLIIQPDYSQIEVRVMVIMANDLDLAKAINEGRDIHTYVTSQVYGIPESEVTKDLRTPTKQITFGILYGQGDMTLAHDLGIELPEAVKLKNNFFAQMPKVKGYIDKQKRNVEQYGYVETIFGRRRYLPDIESPIKHIHAKAYRDSVNSPIQGGASDICWMAQGRIWQNVQEIEIEAVPHTIIHDSIGFDVAPGNAMDFIELAYYEMVYRPYEYWSWLTCRLEADFDIGAGWGNLIGAKVYREGDQLDHYSLGLDGPIDKVDLVCEELSKGYDIRIIEDGAHHNAAEADLGMWERKLHIERPEMRCHLDGRKLIVPTL